MNDDYSIPEALKLSQWQRAKGELMAAVELQGCHLSGDVKSPTMKRYDEFKDAVDAFIKAVEDSEMYR